MKENTILKHSNQAGTSSKSSVRTIYKGEVKKENDRLLKVVFYTFLLSLGIELTGNGFLYNMVRIISGTLVEVGLGKIKPEEIADIIKQKDRRKSR